MADLAKLVEDLSALTVLEAAQLTKLLEEKWGVSAAAPMAMAAPMLAGAPAAGAAAPAAVEQTEFDVILKGFDDAKKIGVIKVVRELTNNALGLKEAKELVEASKSTAQPFKKGVSKEEAEQARAKLAEAGGVVEVA